MKNSDTETINKSFFDFVDDSIVNGGFQNEDLTAIFIPLLQRAISAHENGKVIFLDGIKSILIKEDLLDVDTTILKSPLLDIEKVNQLLKPISNAVDIINEFKETTDTEASVVKQKNLSIQTNKDEVIIKPVYILGYISFETALGHHDALTDIFVLGLVFATLATGLNFANEEDLSMFVNNRKNLIYLTPRIHPTILNVIFEMTELDRRKRTRDIYEAIDRLKNYRDYNPEKEIDITSLEGFKKQDISTRSKWILSKLKSRLFDISRRNRLLYFKNSSKFLNLTVSSVPATLNYKNIDPNSLFIWNDDLASKIKSGSQLSLSKYLKIEDNSYIPSILDKIRSEATHDINEYGFSQLRLVLANLTWYNLKEEENEKINSPLLFLPVELKKKKGVKDHYTLDVTSNEVEVNPVLVYQLKELYDINLPDVIGLDDLDMHRFYQTISDQIRASNSGVKIEFIDKPRIKIIHSLARQTLAKYNKRLRTSNGSSNYKNLDYSYERENFLPLGLRIYKEKIESNPTYLEFLIDEDIKISKYNAVSLEKERNLYSLSEEGETNPYLWEFNICNLSLGNFNYKKMSLVKDYNEIIDNNYTDSVFEELFSENPKNLSIVDVAEEAVNVSKNHHIVLSDPTQAEAIRKAASGENYIIQGPPGTGKSQTITNLIADYVDRGKRVLFVCEKRAAIDVVFFRLKQQKLDDLCCCIHDSQADKKEFILDLKKTYLDFSTKKINLEEIATERSNILSMIQEELDFIKKYNDTISAEFEDVGTSLLKLMQRLIELKDVQVGTSSDITEIIPRYREWIQSGHLVHQLSNQLKEMGYKPFLSSHPVKLLNKEVLEKEEPINYIKKILNELEDLLVFVHSKLDDNPNLSSDLKKNLVVIQELVDDSSKFKELIENKTTILVDEANPLTKEFLDIAHVYKNVEEQRLNQLNKNGNWKNKFSDGDLKIAQEKLNNYDKSFLSFLNPGYWKLKKIINSSYDFSKHTVMPSLKDVLEQLQKEYSLNTELKDIEKRAYVSFRVENILKTLNTLENIWEIKDKPTSIYLSSNLNEEKSILKLCDLKDKINDANNLLSEVTSNFKEKDLDTLIKEVSDIKLSLTTLPSILSFVNEFNKTTDYFSNFIKEKNYTPHQFEKVIGDNTLRTFYQQNKDFQKTGLTQLDYSVKKLEFLHTKMYEINGIYLKSKVIVNFIDNINLSERSVAGLSPEERVQKKVYIEGRKILENEFNKSMRYRSIRDLASKESGKIIQDLKPVWLMSPLSVSDTLPIGANNFDVVIFDEASQITLEEGIPPLFRGKQTIIVGDEMQMPPSNFFGSSNMDEEDKENSSEEDVYHIDADSLLTQGARKLPSVMLGWHYRSRYESLINFSNAAFYNRELLTIPDQTILSENMPVIESEKKEDASQNVEAFSNRSISFHYLKNGVYENRTNVPEAEYIAQLVKDFLKKGNKHSIGVVAFSQEQQHEIEKSLYALGSTDPSFQKLLEEEFERHDNDQFVGLFIKNLENIQGDERDIIIMSVCYGYDSNKRMLMNFGPINRKGGEKRLNVIFSRAKQHMAVVSSIKYSDIKNEYNEGANYFRKFLQYAELISSGNLSSAETVLDSLSKNHKLGDLEEENILTLSVAEYINSLGYEIKFNVGQSYFRCNIGVVDKKNKNKYCLGILIDTVEHYTNENLLEQYVLRPGVLKSFNWNVIQIYTKDWLHNQLSIIERIKNILEAKDCQPAIDFSNILDKQTILDSKKEETLIAKDKTIEENKNLEISDSVKLVFKDDVSDKFWYITQNENTLTINYGRTGTNGQEMTKTFENPEKTKFEMKKLVREKLNKGYIYFL